MDAAFVIEHLLSLLVVVVSASVGALVKTLFARLDRQREEMVQHGREFAGLAREFAELRASLPAAYVDRAEFRKMGDNIFSMLRRIEGTARPSDLVQQIGATQ